MKTIFHKKFLYYILSCYSYAVNFLLALALNSFIPIFVPFNGVPGLE